MPAGAEAVVAVSAAWFAPSARCFSLRFFRGRWAAIVPFRGFHDARIVDRERPAGNGQANGRPAYWRGPPEIAENCLTMSPAPAGDETTTRSVRRTGDCWESWPDFWLTADSARAETVDLDTCTDAAGGVVPGAGRSGAGVLVRAGQQGGQR